MAGGARGACPVFKQEGDVVGGIDLEMVVVETASVSGPQGIESNNEPVGQTVSPTGQPVSQCRALRINPKPRQIRICHGQQRGDLLNQLKYS